MRKMRLRNLWWCFVFPLMLAGCGGDAADDIPPQKWNDLTVDVQSRPAPVVPGMNEFIVIISRGKDKPPPGHDLIVSIRVDESQPWKQMIQDGFMGVFRRAVRVDNPRTQALNVQIQRGDDMGYLRFPLRGPRHSTDAKS